VQGVVIDSKTQLPIKKVKVEVIKEPHIIIYTDSLGKFEFLSKKIGLPCCPQISVSFEKEGYNKATKKYKSWTDNAVVVLEKQEE
jgi:hypothetical protein